MYVGKIQKMVALLVGLNILCITINVILFILIFT